MGDEHERDSHLGLELLQLYLHLFAELEVERAEGLVEEQDAGPVHQGAGQGHPLPLTTRQLVGAAATEVGEADAGEGFLDPPRPLGLRRRRRP